MIRFYRNTHVDGEPREFTDEQDEFWNNDGGTIGHHLSHHTGMTLDDIFMALVSYNAQWENCAAVDIKEMIATLNGLITHDMATIELRRKKNE